MKALWTNDIHLEFLDKSQSDDFIKKLDCGVDAILIAGDIAQAFTIKKYLSQMATLSVPVYFVLGNHDYYRGSIEGVRRDVHNLLITTPNLHWLNESGVIKLTKNTALIGHDGWADGRFGYFDTSSVELNDFHYIRELKVESKSERLYLMQKLADEAVDHLNKVLLEALKWAKEVVVVTHVPPWHSAAWHQGKPSNNEWLPFFSSKVVGQVLMGIMEKHPDKKMLVLCGHTHGGGTSQILPNLLCLTGEAEYHNPRIQGILRLK